VETRVFDEPETIDEKYQRGNARLFRSPKECPSKALTLRRRRTLWLGFTRFLFWCFWCLIGWLNNQFICIKGRITSNNPLPGFGNYKRSTTPGTTLMPCIQQCPTPIVSTTLWARSFWHNIIIPKYPTLYVKSLLKKGERDSTLVSSLTLLHCHVFSHHAISF
jgi:hypothetical protein